MEENNSNQKFWVENSFEPNPDYQPRRKPKKHAEEDPDRRSDRKTDRRAQPMTPGSGQKSQSGGFWKLIKWGCLIVVVGLVVIVALLVGVAKCTGIDDEIMGKHQKEPVVESTVVKSKVSEDEETNPLVEDNQNLELLTTDDEPVGQENTEPVVEDEVESVAKEDEAPVVQEREEPVKATPEPNKVKPKQQKLRKKNNVNTPQKNKGTGYRLEKVDHIPTMDQPSSNKKGTGYRFERIEKQ